MSAAKRKRSQPSRMGKHDRLQLSGDQVCVHSNIIIFLAYADLPSISAREILFSKNDAGFIT